MNHFLYGWGSKAVVCGIIALLVGCTTLGTVPGDSAEESHPAPRADHIAEIPEGPLRPITQGDAPLYTVTGIRPPDNLWERIGRGFAMPDLETDTVRERERWHASRPTYLERMSERSSKYLFDIVEEIERRNMPTELAFVPYIESSLNPTAVSRARAVGLWQFMPATGASLGLKQNAFRDDRRDIAASTNKALDYLQELYDEFGDWHLSLAAYNWGPGNIRKAIAENRKKGLGISYNELRLPEETRQYVPKIQALKNMIADPQRFALTLPPIANHPYSQSVDITQDIDVSLVLELAQITAEEFRALNPSLKGPVIFAAGTPHILLPWDNAEIFRRNLENYSEATLATWTAWTAPSTMSVAEVAKRTGMSAAQLRSINGIPSDGRIQAGSALIVPRPPTVKKDVPAQIANNGQIVVVPDKPARSSPARGVKTKIQPKTRAQVTRPQTQAKVKVASTAKKPSPQPGRKPKAKAPKTKVGG